MGALTTVKIWPGIVAVLAFAYHLNLAVFLCKYTPDSVLRLGVSLSTYAWTGCALSLLGLFGIWQDRPTWIVVFANFLCIDTIVSTIYRILGLHLLLSAFYDDNFCDNVYEATFGSHPTANDSCRDALRYTGPAAVGTLILCTLLQATVALFIRRYSQDLEHTAQETRQYWSWQEKAGLEKEQV